MKGILGRKLGMTQLFSPEGVLLPVTVIEAGPCVVMQRRDEKLDGYKAVQLGFSQKKEHTTTKPELGHAKKAGVAPQRFVREIRGMETADYALGDAVSVDLFAVGDMIDITGISRGKGFAGCIKRHGNSRGPMSHGSNHHRRPGSLGAVDPARVFKGHKLPGRMGGRRATALNLEIVAIKPEQNLLIVHGTVPGPRRGHLIIRSAILQQTSARSS